tara:strand:+ start:234 stop:509 length:276 start_codon:yes stop_codon:yes gene_type:complete
MKKMTLTDCLYAIMKDGGWYTFWQLQEKIQAFGKFYGEATISAGLRKLRNYEERKKYNLKEYGEVVEKRSRLAGKGYEYKLNVQTGQQDLF